MTTNGILLEDFAERLFLAGVHRINISMDSLNAEKYRKITRTGDLQKVLGGIEKARQVGFSPIKINIVAIKGFNDDEILDFARLTFDYPFQIRFIELMPLGNAGIESDGRFLSNDSIRERIETLGKLEQVTFLANGTEGPADIYRLSGGRGEIGLISAISHNFCSSCNRLRLTADGQLRTCLLADDETDLRGPLRSGCSDSELKEIIEGAIAKKPNRHKIAADGNYIKKCVKEMSAIGG
jgi:cyclic pyranopterin phosphate synthase